MSSAHSAATAYINIMPMGLSSLIILLGTSSLFGQVVLAKPDYTKYQECFDHWDVKFPYLVEVRYTGEPFIGDTPQRNYHKNRHGALLTQKAVLTRAHDLDDYPTKSEYVHSNLQECMRGGNAKPCLYVNTRRPRKNDDPDAEMCGSNIIVKRAIQHPHFIRTAEQKYTDLQVIWQNTKYPFAVLELREEVPTEEDQTIFPALVFPRTPLEMLYMTRRMRTMGHDSKLCEYPHYNKLTHGGGYYGPYSSMVKVTTLNCPKDDWGNIEHDRRKCVEDSLCHRDPIYGGSWEGVRVGPSRSLDPPDHVRVLCAKALFYPNVFNNSFILFSGEEISFTSSTSPDPRRKAAEDKLGAPVVCNGVALAITSTWHGRGRGRRDVYIGTSLFRGWIWILEMRKRFQDLQWHRAKDDSPSLGALTNFSKKTYPRKDYDRSVFELSLNEEISPRPGSQANRIHNDFTPVIIFVILQSLS